MRASRRPSLLLLVVCLALVASCGGEPALTTSDGAADAATTSATTASPTANTTVPEQEIAWVSEPIIAASDALADRLGVEEAAVAIVLALDHGYSFDQLMAAATAGSLNADGTITGVDPQYDAYGLIVDGGPSAAEVSAAGAGWAVPAGLATPFLADEAPDPITASAFLERLNEQANPFFSSLEAERKQEQAGRFVVAMISHLSSLGYSFEQIVEGVIFGEITWLRSGRDRYVNGQIAGEFGPCIGLSSGQSAIPPALPRAADLSEDCAAVAGEFPRGEDAILLAEPLDSSEDEQWVSVTTTTTSTTSTTTTIVALGASGAVDEDQYFDTTFVANSFELAIDGTVVTFERFDWAWEYTNPAPAICVSVSNTTFLGSDVTFDSSDGSLRGTVTINDKTDSVGTKCPFGGFHRDVDRVGEVEGTLLDNTITMMITFPKLPEAADFFLNITFEVS